MVAGGFWQKKVAEGKILGHSLVDGVSVRGWPMIKFKLNFKIKVKVKIKIKIKIKTKINFKINFNFNSAYK